ncbi:hypothetical protein JXB12_01030 [candidate division KSB1 bacterium]|nr:hypothetical protein [candidate division KSB1 bacterium]
MKKNWSHSECDDIKTHLIHCVECNQRYKELRAVYDYLNDEITKPVGNFTFKILKEIQQQNISIASVLLKPQLLDEMPGERHFTAELFPYSLEYHTAYFNFLNELPVKKDEVLIRVVQSAHSRKTTLYLYASDKKLYRDVIFKIPKKNISRESDDIGKIELGKFDIHKFQDLEIMIIPSN